MKALIFVFLSLCSLNQVAFASTTTQLRVTVTKKFISPDGPSTKVVKNMDAKSLTVLFPMTPEADDVISTLESGNYICTVKIGSNVVMTYGTWLQPVFSITDCK